MEMTLGQMLTERMKERGLSQADVRRMVGAPKGSMISRWMDDENIPNPKYLLALADKLGLSREDVYRAAHPEVDEFIPRSQPRAAIDFGDVLREWPNEALAGTYIYLTEDGVGLDGQFEGPEGRVIFQDSDGACFGNGTFEEGECFVEVDTYELVPLARSYADALSAEKVSHG